MRSLLRYTLLALPLLGGVVAEQPAAQPWEASNSIYANAHEAFQDLLNALPEESLQAALNSLTKFKAGVFESHRRGVERVHDTSPALATKLIVAAVQDLKKRQVGAPSNGTSSAAPSQTPDQPQTSDSSSVEQPSSAPPPSDTPSPSPSDAPSSTPASRPVIVPVEVTTTNTVGSTIVETSSVLSEVTASVEVTIIRTTTNAAGSTVAVTTQEPRPAIIRTTTDSRGSSVAITSAANFAPTRGEVLTTTNAEGSTFLTTFTPGGGRVSSVRLITTTDEQGRPQTLTSTSYVDPTDVGGADEGGEAGASQTARPSVQNGAVRRSGAAWAGVAGLGAFAVFF